MMAILRTAIFLLILSSSATAQTDSARLRQIADEIMLRGKCYADLRVLCKTIGHRLSGSPQAAKAVEWGKRTLETVAADRVWLQPVDVPHWVRGQESLLIDFGKGFQKVPLLSLGNSEGTGGKPLDGPVVMVRNFEEFEALPDAAIANKVVFFNYRFRQDLISTFDGYGDAGPYRWRGPNRAAARKAKAVIIRSVSTGVDDYPHTGSMRYLDTVKRIPAVAIGNTTADALEKACVAGKPKIRLTSNCRMVDTVRSYNVIAELMGAEIPDEIVVVGGHLDSWDVGEGAHDDGAGCVQAIEVLRTFKSLGIRPKRTVRAVLYMNEENGVRGGHAYADSAIKAGKNHIFALESDAGGFSPRGFAFDLERATFGVKGESDVVERQRQAIRSHFTSFGEQLSFLNLHNFSGDHGGTDIDPLKRTEARVVLAGLSPDPQRYFDYHHTAADVFEAVNHRELKLGAAAMAGLIWLVAEHGW